MKKIIKAIYHTLPHKKKVFDFVKLFFNLPKSIYQHLYFFDTFETPVSNGSKFRSNHFGTKFENDLYWRGIQGCWEPQSLKIWEQLSTNAQVVMDIGSNTGIYSLVAGATNKNAQIFAFEPIDRVYKKLLQNIQLNNFNIEAYNFAVSNKSGVADIYDLPDDNMRQASFDPTLLKNDKKFATKVKTETLSSFIRQKNIQSIDLIKIDVEGHEAEVLEGFGDTLIKFKPYILIEILNKHVAEKAQSILSNSGYTFFYHMDEKNGPFRVDTLIPHTSRNYICSATEVLLNTRVPN